jgi:dTDP-4-dehydrorhamnose 3,5-epimerase
MALELEATYFDAIKVMRSERYYDARGHFEEVARQSDLERLGVPTTFVQDNHSQSVQNVIRGLHYQRGMGKLLFVLYGSIQLVELDIRPNSPTFGQHCSVVISRAEPLVVWIPAGFANGFCVLTERANVLYRCTAYYDAQAEKRINPLDPDLGIRWATKDPILSAADAAAPSWGDARHYLQKSVESTSASG